MTQTIQRAITTVVNVAAHWLTVLVVTAYVVVWAITDRPFDNLDFASALSVWMLFAVLHVAVRDGRAVQTKMDAIALGIDAVDNRVVGIDDDLDGVDAMKDDIVAAARTANGQGKEGGY